LALCWSLVVAIFVAAVGGATVYYGAKFRLMNLTVGEVVFVMSVGVLSASIPVYFRTLPIIIARAPKTT
jgi:hypothetical protein